MLLNHRRALRVVGGLATATLVMFALVGWSATRPAVQRVDDAFLNAMEAIRLRPLTLIFEGISLVGSVWINWTLRVGALILLIWRRRWLQFAAFLLAVATSEALIGPLKVLFDRARPTGALIRTSGASFPSGHAIAGTVTAVGLVLVLMNPGPRRWQWELRAALFATAMALSRTYLGAHWLSDVIAGALLGTTIAIAWPALLQEARTRYQARELGRVAP